MKKVVFIIFVLCCVALVFEQCRHKEAPVEVQKFDRDSFLRNNPTIHKADSMAKVEQQSEEERSKTVTSIKFDKEVYDFGECTEGDIVKKTIEFTNTGKLPLVIKSAWGSCGCTVPTFDKEPVAPGNKGKIDIQFNSTGKSGANTKQVTVDANTTPETSTIEFSIKVKSKKKGWF